MDVDISVCSSPPAVEFPLDGDAFETPGAAVEPGAGGRQWSSLKSSASPPSANEDERERTKSLPAYGSIFHITYWGFKSKRLIADRIFVYLSSSGV